MRLSSPHCHLTGLEVGDKLSSTEALKAQWEEFKARERKEREEATTTHKGVYQCRCSTAWVHVLLYVSGLG